MSTREEFRRGFLRKCAEAGLTADQIAAKLNDREIKAVADYMAGLR